MHRFIICFPPLPSCAFLLDAGDCGAPSVADGWWILVDRLDSSPPSPSESTGPFADGTVLELICRAWRVRIACLQGTWSPDPETVCPSGKQSTRSPPPPVHRSSIAEGLHSLADRNRASGEKAKQTNWCLYICWEKVAYCDAVRCTVCTHIQGGPEFPTKSIYFACCT